MKRKRTATLNAYSRIAAMIPDAYDRPNCCLNAVRVTIDALGKFGIEVRPMSVEVEARGSKDGVNYVVAIDTRDNFDGNYPGHVVGLVGDILIDPSAGQFHRPLKGILVPEVFICTIDPAKFERGEPASFANEQTATLITYTARPLDRAFFSAPGFSRRPNNDQVTREVVRAMKATI